MTRVKMRRQAHGRWGGKSWHNSDGRSRRFLLESQLAHLKGALSGGRSSLPPRRVDPAVASRLAGARGTSATPMEPGRRARIYSAQRHHGRLTPRQNRRINHKLNREMLRAVLKGGA